MVFTTNHPDKRSPAKGELQGATGEVQARGKYGARIYLMKDGVILVKQTIKKGASQNDPYVIDEHRERHVDPDEDDASLGRAVRTALEGKL